MEAPTSGWAQSWLDGHALEWTLRLRYAQSLGSCSVRSKCRRRLHSAACPGPAQASSGSLDGAGVQALLLRVGLEDLRKRWVCAFVNASAGQHATNKLACALDSQDWQHVSTLHPRPSQRSQS